MGGPACQLLLACSVCKPQGLSGVGAGWVPALGLLAQCLLRPYPGPKGLIFDYVLTQLD